MSDPRLTLSFQGIDQQFVTMQADGVTIVYDSTQPYGCASAGLAVRVSADSTVALTIDGSSVFGKLIEVAADGRCTVQYEGFTVLPAGASATVTAGSRIVGALGAASAKGYIRNSASATAAEVNTNPVIIIDASDTANVVVHFC